MKICWDNLENIRLSNCGNFRHNGNGTLYYHEACLVCLDPFLGTKISKYCTTKCYDKSEERKQKGKEQKGKNLGVDSSKWDGGYASNGIPKYDLYAPRLEPYEECRRNEKDPIILEVKCTYCGTWHIPRLKDVKHRIGGIDAYTLRFYCSLECKQICPLYGMKVEYLIKQDMIKANRTPLKELRNEVPGWIKKKVLELDDYTCQMCGSKDKLHVHHEIPSKRNQMLALDVENCISMCIPCHVWVHTQIDGCRYNELANSELC